MVLEEVLTIIFALGAAAALIVYAARPRHRGLPISAGHSAVGSYAPAAMGQAAPSPQVTVVETPVVEISPPAAPAPAEVAPVVADATAMAEQAPAAPAPTAEAVETPVRRPASAHRTQRKRSTATKPRAKPTRKAKKS